MSIKPPKLIVKSKKCKKCGLIKPIWGKGLCVSCSTKTPLNTSTPLKSNSKIKSKKRGKSKEVQNFYKELTDTYKYGSSIESGKIINPVTAVNLAHIFPKEIYKSVATDPDNIILLTWEEHTLFDNLLLNHSFEKLEEQFPNSWKKICSKIQELLPKIEEEKSLKIKLKQYLDEKPNR